jgi:hypothetical protein
MANFEQTDPPMVEPPVGVSGGSRAFDPAAVIASMDIGGAYNSATQENEVLRSGWIVRDPRSSRDARGIFSGLGKPLSPADVALRQRKQKTAALTEYNAEFFSRWADPNFQTWLTSRMAAMGVKDRSAEGAYSFWVTSGEKVSNASGGQSPSGFTGTPEQYIEYMANGGRFVTLDQVEADIAAGAMAIGPDGVPVDPFATDVAQSPIQTTTQRNFATINPQAANAMVDDLSRALLGRMATEKEMKKLRGAMNKYLAKNPTVTKTITDSTNPDDVVMTTNTTDGASAADAQAAAEMKMRRSSEGQAFNAGKMFEDAFRMMG